MLHTLTWAEGERFVRTFCQYRNQGEKPVTLLLLSSFSLEQISPYLPGDGAGDLMVHRLQSRWSQEGRLLSQSVEELQLEPSWGLGAVRCERFGQVGSMPVNHYFPFLALEDTKNHVYSGERSLGHPASWQMEIYRMDENLAISGGLADRDFGPLEESGAAGRKLLYAGGCSYHSPHRFSGYSLPAACGGGGESGSGRSGIRTGSAHYF